MATTKKKQTFEERMAALEEVAEKMDSSSLPLTESLKQYEAAMKEILALEGELSGIMQRVTVLRQQADGSLTELPLEEMDEEKP